MFLIYQLIVIALLFVAGYQRATWFRKRHGRTQWGWPPLVWGLVWASSLLAGAVLTVIAERSGRARASAPISSDGSPRVTQVPIGNDGTTRSRAPRDAETS